MRHLTMVHDTICMEGKVPPYNASKLPPMEFHNMHSLIPPPGDDPDEEVSKSDT